jgi:hypothetical protein
MDHRFKVKVKLFFTFLKKFLEDDIRENLPNVGLGKAVLDTMPKSPSMKETKLVNWISSKLESFHLRKALLKYNKRNYTL